jgi:eukaryotic-like serine/threonine-protein kinase
MSIGSASKLPDLGQYQLIGKIAEGGMGAVYMGRHKMGGPIVAVKVLPAETARNPLLLKRFEQEFRAAALIDHPNVVKGIEYCGELPRPFLVMEYVPGCSLGQKIERGGPLSEEESIHIIRQVCDGLHCAHKQGLIHRDVKPDNVLLTEDLIAKLTDLGLVRDVESDENLTRTGRGLGTPHYMAPEQFRNAKNVDVRTDVYALGATLYMMVTGKVPFAKCSPLDCWMRKTKDDFPPPKSLMPKLSDRMDFAIRRAMSAETGARPTSCREFMEDLLGGAWKSRSGAPSAMRQPSLPSPVAAGSSTSDLWYMVYYDAGIARTVKGSTDTVRSSIESGVLGDLTVVLVSRVKSGPFSPLKSIPEFRDLVFTSRDSSAFAALSTRRSSPMQPALQPAPAVAAAPSKLKARSTHDTPAPSKQDTPLPIERLIGQEMDVVGPTRDRTEVLQQVPVTRSTNLNVGTDERPKLAIQDVNTVLRSSGTRRFRWLMVAALLGAMLFGLLVGLTLR